MIFSLNFLQSFFSKKLPHPERIGEILNMRSFEVESIEKRDNDFLFDIDVLPNRAPDCLSHLGIAREISAILAWPLKKIEKIPLRATSRLKEVEIKIENPNDCPRYTGLLVENVKVTTNSPDWLKQRLQSCGVQPINNVVDIANYVMLEIGQPVHVFDFDKIAPKGKNKTIFIKRAKKGEKIYALDDKTYFLDEEILTIADSLGPLAIAGVKGGQRAAVDQNTTKILIESANFNRNCVRVACQKLKLYTDASLRFSYSVPKSLVIEAQERIFYLLKKIAHASNAKLIDVYPQKEKRVVITVPFEKINSILGINLQKEKVVKILKSLGFEIKKISSEKITVSPPEWRVDIRIEEDVIEEIGRMFGFENIPAKPPRGEIRLPQENEKLLLRKKIQDALKGWGFSEVLNYSFLGDDEKEKFNLKAEVLVELQNPLSKNNKYLRPCLYTNLVKRGVENLKFFDQVQLFEIGKVFNRTKNKAIKEQERFGILWVQKGQGDKIFYRLKGLIEVLLEGLGIKNFSFQPFESRFFHPQKTALVISGKQKIGILGEIHPEILKNLNCPERIFLFEGKFENLEKVQDKMMVYRPVSPYTSVVRDLSLLVEKNVLFEEVLRGLEKALGKSTADIKLLEVHEGKGIPEAKKNFVFRIYYQNPKKQLTSEEVNEIHQKVVKTLEKKYNWQVRK